MTMISPVRDDEMHLSYLPMAHLAEKNLMACMYMVGGSAAFYHGDIAGIAED